MPSLAWPGLLTSLRFGVNAFRYRLDLEGLCLFWDHWIHIVLLGKATTMRLLSGDPFIGDNMQNAGFLFGGRGYLVTMMTLGVSPLTAN